MIPENICCLSYKVLIDSEDMVSCNQEYGILIICMRGLGLSDWLTSVEAERAELKDMS